MKKKCRFTQTQRFCKLYVTISKIGFIFLESTIEMLQESPISVVSEKLDGSNLSVSSNGVIASRRQILLVDPKPEDLNRTKFCGEPLTSLESILDSAKNMKKHFFQKVRI